MAAALRPFRVPPATVVDGARNGFTVVGVDDHELAEVIGLTTVAQPVAGRGAEAARLRLQHLDSPDTEPPGHGQMPTQESRYHPACGTFPK
ncbi:hypothetical protein [Streptomyces sp. KM273126]|uniref:hypothetical protein n=1 Tax=Streptomyces sp. KM273126 TaxID=2545247 RepID=UPI00215DB43F|nr:hypothetical protein [Streptomyces sp. KM273126]